MTETGNGPPIVFVPGIQGRWEWMSPAIRALAARHRVLSFSLGEVQGGSLFEKWNAHIDRLLDRAGEPAATLVGVSFGGLVATYYAAHRRHRVRRLVLVSAPSPRWQIDPQSAGYVRRPRRALPFFALRAVRRLSPEILAALPTARERVGFAARYAVRVVRFPPSAPHMAGCVHEWARTDLVRICRAVEAPTLVITGEEALDRVVPVTSSLEYLDLIAEAQHVTLERTGHIGLLSRPQTFATIVTDFIGRARSDGHAPGTLARGESHNGASERSRTSRSA
jgi:pimeloyl-ACP methyl ester carboxylesterase